MRRTKATNQKTGLRHPFVEQCVALIHGNQLTRVVGFGVDGFNNNFPLALLKKKTTEMYKAHVTHGFVTPEVQQLAPEK